MTENIFVKLLEHNNWTNDQIIQACYAINSKQLDAEPQSATMGSIRSTLIHLVAAQQGYLSLLTLPVEARSRGQLQFTELQESARRSGNGLLALVREMTAESLRTQLKTTDGFFVEPWVVLVQVINHATEHREQIKSMLSSLGVTPPDIDGWDFGFVTKALIPEKT